MFVLNKKPDYIEIIVSGKIKNEDYANLEADIIKAVKPGEDVKLLCEVDSIKGIETGVIRNDMKFGGKEMGKISKMAIVSDEQWVNILMSFLKPFYRDHEKAFKIEDKQKAIEWLLAT